MKAIQHTKIINTPLRVNINNAITVNTKRTRPVIIPRENIDTPPAITDHVRELASLIRNTNSITAHEHRDLWKLDARINQPYEIKPRYRPLWVCMSAPVKGKARGRWYTEYGNIQPEDKPAFRHDSMFLFDILSEDYSA